MSDRTSANDNWKYIQREYNNIRDSGKSHEDAIKLVQAQYSGVGPANQQRLQDGYKPANQQRLQDASTVISTLDLKLLTKGGGSWNIDKYNLKKSVVTTFEGQTVLKCQYDKNSGTSNDPGVGGCSFTAIPDGMNKDAVEFSWEVYYPRGFQFAKGGKYGGVLVGYGAASGYQHSKTGASNRIMWQQDGGIIDYIYPAEDLKQTNPRLIAEGHGCGFFNDDFQKALKFDSWNKIELGTKMNTFQNGIPQSDGETSVTVNGHKKILKGINWSRSPDLKISQFDLGTFFGGPSPSPVSQFCYFKNFQMSKY